MWILSEHQAVDLLSEIGHNFSFQVGYLILENTWKMGQECFFTEIERQ